MYFRAASKLVFYEGPGWRPVVSGGVCLGGEGEDWALQSLPRPCHRAVSLGEMCPLGTSSGPSRPTGETREPKGKL